MIPLAHRPAPGFPVARRSVWPIGLGVIGLLLGANVLSAQPNTVGLSSVRAQRFGNDATQGFTPQASDYFGFTLATGDFDGDGVADLATGMPFDNGAGSNPILDSGSIVVRHGAAGAGLIGAPVYLGQRDATEPDDRLGWSLAACDLNGDGYDDLAAGLPTEDYLGKLDAGIVQVHYGYTTGLPLVADTFFAQSTPGVPSAVEPGDRFGWSLACADFDGDGYDDLAVGAPGERHHWELGNPSCPPGGAGCKANVGQVFVVPGSPSGLDYARSSILDQDTDGVPNEQDDGDNFGHALAAGDFDGDGYADLAVGTPGEDDFAGGVAVLFGHPQGLHAAGEALFLGENVLGGVREDEDTFGASLAVGDLDGDGFADLVIGIPGEEGSASIPDSGRIGVLYGHVGGFDMGRPQLWDEHAVFHGTSETGDAFGTSLAIGDFDRDGFDDLAIGHPGEYILGIHDGAVTILMGSAVGLTGQRCRGIAAGVHGMPGDYAQTGEQFGHALAAGDFDGDGHDDLAVGSPGENEAGVSDVGAEAVLYGALFADGVESGNTALWPQASFVSTNNRLEVTSAARLGPPASKRGIQLSLINPSFQRPGFAAFVRVGPESGFANERRLSGEFFIDPQNLTMSTTPGANGFQLMAFTDGVASGSKVWLLFNLVRNSADGDWFLNVQHFNEETGTFQFSGGGAFALDGTPSFSNNRLDFVWAAGNPGRLTMWRTRFLDGAPDATGRVQMFAAALPGMNGASINHAFVGMFGGHDPGTFGTLYLDEIGFRRGVSPTSEGGPPPPR